MEPLPLLTRPENRTGTPKWPFVVAGIAFFILLVVGNIFVERSASSESVIPHPRSTTPPLEVALQSPRGSANVSPDWSIYFDPTLMVLPNEHSYSKTYLSQKPVWQMPLFDLSVSSAPYEFHRPYFPANETVTPGKGGSWSQQSPTVMVETPASSFSETLPPISMVSLFGELDNRPLLSLPDFPNIAHSELLMPTEISIGVDASGTVKVAVLNKSCGDDATDELALKLVRQISFAPASQTANRLAWGQIKISWVVNLKSAKP